MVATYFHPTMYCDASTPSAVVGVSAIVRPWITFKVDQHVHNYQVTSADIERGYIDLPASATVVIRTNDRKNILINVASMGSERILIREAGIGIYEETGSMVDPGRYATGASIVKILDYRVIIPSGTPEGIYAIKAALSPQMY